jgi:hypothetical protein
MKPSTDELATIDCDGKPLHFLDRVQSSTNNTHFATVGPVYADGTFDVCDVNIGLFPRQRPEQWRAAPRAANRCEPVGEN